MDDDINHHKDIDLMGRRLSIVDFDLAHAYSF
jgi:hypothetical protein